MNLQGLNCIKKEELLNLRTKLRKDVKITLDYGYLKGYFSFYCDEEFIKEFEKINGELAFIEYLLITKEFNEEGID